MIEEEKLACSVCPKTFASQKLLQQHQHMFHTDKSFICEICGKAFRFRSNLAEHRSVHTALKPYVCKFCGKSSRLKGNLTKHILKHHKKEQNDNISKDDIIVKKDPAAQAELLEKMALATTGQSLLGVGSEMPSLLPKEEKSDPDYERAIYLSFGLEQSSMDLTGSSSPDNDMSENGTESGLNGSLQTECGESQLSLSSSSPLPAHTIGGAQCLQALLAQVQAQVAASETATPSPPPRRASSGSATPAPSAANAPGSSRTQCSECGKHFRKGSALQLHMTLNHGMPPPAEDRMETPALSGASSALSHDDALLGEGDISPVLAIQQDIHTLKAVVSELVNDNKERRLEQAISLLDDRVCRLEKNVETVLNSMYSLVQLQTGLNSSLSRFREDALEQLRVLRGSLDAPSNLND